MGFKRLKTKLKAKKSAKLASGRSAPTSSRSKFANKLNITYFVVAAAILAMSVTNCGRQGSRYVGPFYGGDYCQNYNKNNRGRGSYNQSPGQQNRYGQNYDNRNGYGQNYDNRNNYGQNYDNRNGYGQNYGNRDGRYDNNYTSAQHRYGCDNSGKFVGSSWNGMSLTTANPSGRETIRITNKDVFDNFLELLGVCANTRWSGLHAQFVIGNQSCRRAVENLRLGLNIFLDHSPTQDSYAETDAYIWHNDMTHLHDLEPWIIQEGRFTRVNDGREFEIIYELFSERTANFKVRVRGTPEDLEDCNNTTVSISFANKQMARGSIFSSDNHCRYSR